GARGRPAGDRPWGRPRLIREWQGVEHCVTVLDDGYEYQGRPYKSLSAIARAITGTRWNGWILNEFAVAKVLAHDKHLRGPITYEPDLSPSSRKIDFVADRLRDNLYVEVKTVHPETAETE